MSGGFVMPPEWAPHRRTWMAWPSSGYTLGSDDDAIASARAAWASVANAISKFEDVVVLAETKDIEIARGYLADKVIHT